MGDDRKSLLKDAQAAVKKAFKGSISDVAAKALEFPSVFASSGSLALDRLCSGRNPGGLPIGESQGRIVHIAGEWSTGKSLLLDHWMQDVIVNLKGLAKCSETEGSRDPHFANAIGLPLDLLSIDRPDTIEQMFDMFEEWHDAIRKRDRIIPIIWGIDSLDSTEAEKSAKEGLSKGGGWHYGGGRAEAMGAGLRRMAKTCSRFPTTMVMLNQTRDNVGVMFGPKKRTPLGNPPHFYASLEIMLSGSPRTGSGFVRSAVPVPPLTKEAVGRLGLHSLYAKDKDGSEKASDKGAVIGRYIRAKITKTKMATTMDSTADFYIDFRRGIHRWEGLAERMMFEGVLKCAPNGMEDYDMPGQLLPDGTPAKFATKREWLNYIRDHMEVLSSGQPGDQA